VPLGGKWRPLVGKVREWYVESWHLQGCSPHLCQLMTDGLALHEQVLNIQITCRWYRPSKPSSLTSTEGGFTPTASMAGLGEKLGTDPWIGQPSCCGLCWEPFFSGVVALSFAIDDLRKGCYVLTTWDTYGLGLYVDRAWDACGVLVRFSPAGCTSIQITVTLEYEYRLFVALIT
jgi:hypothetical protein